MQIKSMNKYAFTLIELIMVIVILIVLATGATVILGNIQQQKIGAAADKIAADLRYAQTLAYASHDNCGIAFSTTLNNYTVYENNDTNDPAIDPLTKGDFIIDFDSLSEYSGVSITTASFGAGSETIYFDSFGVPHDGNGTALASNGQIMLNNSKTILVYPETGTVEVQ